MKGTKHGKEEQRRFWAFVDKLAERLGAETGSYWVAHQGGNLNLAGLLFSNKELAWGFTPPGVKPGRGRQDNQFPSSRSDSSQVSFVKVGKAE